MLCSCYFTLYGLHIPVDASDAETSPTEFRGGMINQSTAVLKIGCMHVLVDGYRHLPLKRKSHFISENEVKVQR